jgi:hypothetical protein
MSETKKTRETLNRKTKNRESRTKKWSFQETENGASEKSYANWL